MIIERLKKQVGKYKEKTAVITGDDRLTYGELDSLTDDIATGIRLGTDAPITALLFQHGSRMIAAVLAALKANKTYVPFDPNYPAKRLTYMLEDSEAGLLVTNNANVETAQHLLLEIRKNDPASHLRILNIDAMERAENETAQLTLSPTAEPAEDDLAYILYTSGSTGQPKGVMQTQKNVLHFIDCYIKDFEISESDRLTLFSAFSHDAAVMDIYSALLSGATLYPLDIKQADISDISSWLNEEKITVWHSVPTVYRYFINTLTGGETFPQLRLLVMGGEAVLPDDIYRFKTHFPDASFVNLYGQSESSYNSSQVFTKDTPFEKILLGEPIDEVEFLLVDEEGEEVAPFREGEIIVVNDHVALGYWKDPEKTEAAFAEDEELGKLYYTGDKGRLMLDGGIEFTGRIDFQVKIRGYRVELGEIETALLQQEAVEETVVMAKDQADGNTFLCAYVVPAEGQTVTAAQLREFLRQELLEHMIPTYFVHLEKLPVTPTGKIDRKALPQIEGHMMTGVEYAPPTTPIEETLVTIWGEILDLEKVGIDDSFFDIGGHSLRATVLAARIHKQLDVEFPLKEIFRTPTIRGMAKTIGEAEKSTHAAIEAVEKREYYPVSPGQQRFYMLQQQKPDSTAFNMPNVLPIESRAPGKELENVFRVLIRRHESFRTSFKILGDTLVQRVHEDVDFELGHYRAVAPQALSGLVDGFVKPFDLARSPLLRAALVETIDHRRMLMIDLHHIISDGTSQQILATDFNEILSGATLPPLPLQYKDFAQWQNRLLQSEAVKEHEAFWLEHLKSPLPLIELPGDFPRPREQSIEGALLSITLDKQLAENMSTLVRSRGCTLYTLLLAVTNVLIHRYTGLEDIIIGSPTAGRTHVDLEMVMGLVMQSIFLRNYPIGAKPFSTFLEEVKTRTLDAMEHQSYPYEALIEKIDVRESAWNPVTSFALIVQNMTDMRASHRGETVEEAEAGGDTPHVHSTSKLDLTIFAWEGEDGIRLDFEYCTALFKQETMERLAGHFVSILKEAVKNPGSPIACIDIMGDDEKTALMRHAERCYPLTHAQKRIYYTEMLNPGTSCNTVAYTLGFKRKLDTDILKAAIDQVLLKNDALRLRIKKFDFDNHPSQYIAPYEPYTPHTFDYRNVPGSRERLEQWLKDDMKKHFPLMDTPLYYFAHFILDETDLNETHLNETNLNETESVVYLKLHHIVSDGWTVFLLSNQITACYEALERGETIADPPNPSYIDYIRDELEYLSSLKKEESREFWHKTLLPLPEEHQLSLKTQREAVDNIAGGVIAAPVPTVLRDKLHAYCSTAGTSLFKLFLAALSVYLARASAGDEVVIASYGHNRGPKVHRETMGMFAGTFLLRIHTPMDRSFSSLVEKCGETTNYIIKNQQQYPYDLLAGELREATGIDCGYLLNVNLVGHPDVPEEKFRMEHRFPEYEPTPLTIHINVANQDIHGRLELEWDYRKQLFTSEDITRMHGHLMTILEDAMATPGLPLSRIRLLPETEKEEILHRFNRRVADAPLPYDRPVFRYIEEAAQKHPDNIAVVGPSHATPEQSPLTYAELNRKADELAGLLMEKGITADSIAAVLVTPSVEMVVALLAVSKAGGAYLPIDPAYPEERIRYMLEDSNAQLLLTTSATGKNIPFTGETIHIENHAPKASGPMPPAALRGPRGGSPWNPDGPSVSKLVPTFQGETDGLAYIIYTSGSTGRPKGVAVEHRNLTAYVNAFENEFQLHSDDVVVQQASFAFDAFVEELYPILLKGGKLVIPKREQVKDIGMLADFIALHKVTMITCSPLMLNVLNQMAAENDRRLDSIRIFISGGDVLRKEYIDTLMKNAHVYNTYGPTEATVCASYYRCTPDSDSNIPIGTPIAAYKIAILDIHGNLQPVGLNGELCIGGPGVTRGYLNNPGLSAKKFTTLTHFPCKEHTFYRTGDSAHWLPDGNIRFTGRLDNQVQIRGFRIEMGEIENRLLKHPDIKEAAVVLITKNISDSFLAAYFVATAPVEVSQIREFLAVTMPEYMVPTHIIQLERIPLLPNGKLNKQALPAPDTGNLEDITLPTDPIELRLAAVWTTLLGLDDDSVGRDSDFFRLGGHSLKAMLLVSKIKKEFAVEFAISHIFQHSTLTEMTEAIQDAGRHLHTDTIEKAEKREYYPLTYNQQRIYILQKLAPLSPAYNMPLRVPLDGDIRQTVIRKVVKILATRHEALRTGLIYVHHNTFQYVADTVELPFQFHDLSADEEKESGADEIYRILATTVFPMDKLPLFRAVLVKLDNNHYEFMFNMHHIISDGWSVGVLRNDFLQIYNYLESLTEHRESPPLLNTMGEAPDYPSLPGPGPADFTYIDFTLWHNRRISHTAHGTETNPALELWKQKMAGGIPDLSLPADYSKNAESATGAKFCSLLPRELKDTLNTTAGQRRTSLFTLLFAAYIMMLMRVSNQEDIGCSVIVAGRDHEELQHIVGLFVNSILLKIHVDRDESFDAFLERVNKEVMDCFQYQDYPLELVFRALNIRYPEISVSFNMLSILDTAGSALPAHYETGYMGEVQDVKFDLEPYITEYDDAIVLEWVYRKDMFAPATVEFMVAQYRNILERFISDPDKSLRKIMQKKKKNLLKKKRS